MQAFLNRLRTQPGQKAEQSSIPFSENTSSRSSQEPAEPIVSSPPNHFDGIRKIHPNQDELLSSNQETAIQSPNSRRGSANELGMRVPSALARVANRKVTPTGIDETIRESSELQRPEELDDLPPPESSPSRKQNLSLFSAVPFSGATGWSTFGRNQKEKQSPTPLTEDRLANTRRVSEATVSRTSSQSRTTTTATRTPPTKTSGLSRSSSAKLSRNDSTKHPPSSAIEQASYSRVPLVPTHDIHENTSLSIAEGEASPSSRFPHQQDTPSSPDTRPLSVFNNARVQEHIDGTYPPRTAVTKKEESPVASSLPFTFGRQPPARPLAENLFISEFGSASPSEDVPHHTSTRRFSADLASKAAVPGGNQWPSMVAEEMIRLVFSPHGADPSPQPTEPFPLLGTPTSDLPPSSGHARPRAHHVSDSSTDPYGGTSDENANGGLHGVPSLVSDHSNAEPSSSQGTGRGWAMDLPLRGMASFGSSGDELTNPRVASSWTNPSGGGSRFEAVPRIRQMSGERRRRRTGSSSSGGIKVLSRRISSEKPMTALKEKGQSLPGIGLFEPVTVFPLMTTSSQEFPKQGDSNPVATTSTHQTSDEPASNPPTTSNLQVTPAVEVTAPTPRPSPARSRSRSNRLTDLFTRDALRIPDGHAHASGIGVVGVEPHSRRQSLKVMGKRKAGESEEDEIVVHDERGYRPRFDSGAPSSYHRKRMKLSNASASEKDAAALRASRAASRSGAPSTNSFDSSSRPATAAAGGRRNLSRNASAVSIPISAILSPRAPSIRRSISGASRRSDGFRYEDPLRNRYNRNQRRRKRETFADSWILDRDEMPVQAWLFLAGFLFPLCWWAALVIPVRRGGKGKGPESGHDASADKSGSGLWVDQAQYDEELSRMWRTRCLIAAIISTLAYVPIIVCAVIFSRR